VSSCGKTAHVDADLGDDDLRGQVTDAWDGPQQTDRLTERVKIAVHLVLPRPEILPSRGPIASPECSRSIMAASSANTL